MENTANAKLTAYVAELNAAKHAVHRLRQIEQHLQETVQRQEDELVKLRLSNFKSDSDKNLNKHLKARIAVQADEYEKLREQALRAEKLVSVRDAQLEDAKNVVRALRKSGTRSNNNKRTYKMLSCKWRRQIKVKILL